MNTHDKIELPPLPSIDVMGKKSPQIWFTAAEVDALRRAAIEADRKRIEVLDNVARSSRSVDQLKEALQDRSQRFTASYSEVMNLIKFYESDHQNRGEPVGIVKRPSESHFPGVQWMGDVRDGDHLYTTPQPAEHNIDYKELYEQMCNRCDSLDAKLAEYERRGEPVAEGWQFVPKEPTPEMLAAFHSGFKNELHKNDRRRTMSAEEAGLRAMLNAAPQPAEPGRGEPVAEVVRDTCGGYSYIKWKTGYKAEVGG